MVSLQPFDEGILILFTMGKFDEIFELPHMLRITCALDK